MHFTGPSAWFRPEAPAYLVLLLLVPISVLAGRHLITRLGVFRGNLAIGCRSLVIVLLVLAMSGLEYVRRTDDQAVVFVLDTSQSVAAEQQEAGFDFVQRAAETLRKGKDRVGFVVFGGAAGVEQVARDQLIVDRLRTAPRNYETNIEAGLRMAAAMLPPDAAGRVVLISDGNETAGDALTEADRMDSFNVPVDVLPLSYRRDNDVVFDRLRAPATAHRGEKVELGMLLRSTTPTRGRLLLYHNDDPIDIDPSTPGLESAVELTEGINAFSLPFEMPTEGVHRFRATFIPDDAADDAIPANNEARAFTVVAGGQRILIVGDGDLGPNALDGASLRAVEQSLDNADVSIDVADVSEASFEPESLMRYALVVLSDVSAISLGEQRQAALASYVRDLGGGLIAIGGDNSFSVGGYDHSTLESVLPVRTDRQQLIDLSLSMIVVIDESGSMAGEKIATARRAASGAVELLNPVDRIGVIGFSSIFRWIVPLTPCGNRNRIQSQLNKIGAGGGTDMHPALVEAAKTLAEADTNLRHIILLTDGQTAPADFDKLAQVMSDASITISAIAIGGDADRNLLARLADKTGGRMYITQNAAALPQIFARETAIAGRTGIYDQPFQPQMRPGAHSPIVAGLSAGGMPPMNGHVITAAKPEAIVPIDHVLDDKPYPILAHWQVGLGRSVAFTGGLWPRWAPGWPAWPGFAKLWKQAAAWAARASDSNEYEVQVTVEGDRARVTLDANEPMRLMRGGVQMEAVVVSPGFERSPLTLRQTRVGRFEGTFPVSQPGTYLVRAAYRWREDGAVKYGRVQTGVSVAYGAEWRNVSSNDRLLAEVASRTNGRMLDPARPELVFDASTIRPVETRKPIWLLLVWMAMGAFLLDVAVRRIAFDPAEVAAAFRRFIAPPRKPDAKKAAETLTSLREVRDRTRQAQTNEDEAADAEQSESPEAHSNPEAHQQ